MISKIRMASAAGIALAVAFFVPAPTSAAPAPPDATEALFNLNADSMTPLTSPFPSNLYTVHDNRNKTHLRVSLPYPDDCTVRISDCEDVAVLNELDGFNVMPRLSIPFSGPIDPNTVNSGSVFLVSLGTAGFGGDYMPWGTVIGINQVVWDPDANTLHVISDQSLAQHTRFALIVTSKVLDANGAPVAATQEFRQFRDTMGGDYKMALTEAIQAAGQDGVQEQDIAVASVFTTQSATAIMEKIRDQIHDRKTPPAPADFVLGLNGERTVFSLDQVRGITWNRQTLVNSPYFGAPYTVDLTAVKNEFVGSIAYGKYASRNYLVQPHQYIPAVGTRNGVPKVQKWEDIYFNLYLPSGAKPLNGWPVVIFVHGVAGNKEETALDDITSMAKHGIATITINDVGSGYGPLSTLGVSLNGFTELVTLTAGGRSIDQDGGGTINSREGMQAAAPRSIVVYSDTYRQTAADLMQLVRVIEVGMDVDGDGRPDVNPERIYLLPHSLGSGIGTIFFAVEPDVRVGVIDVPFDPVPGAVLSCDSRSGVGKLLQSRQPSLLNPVQNSRITFLDGCGPVGAPLFNENFPLRNMLPLTVELKGGNTMVIQSPVTNGVAGAMEIQAALENAKWVGQAGSPLAYAPHLRKAHLKGVPPKSLLFLMAKGDQGAPNPSGAAIARAGELADVTLYFRHDLYYADNHVAYPTLDKNPHSFAVNFGVNSGEISAGVQEVIGEFFASDGGTIVFPEPRLYFEFPIVELPESLNYSSIK